MGFSYQSGVSPPAPPIEYESVETANPTIPTGAIGFSYVLCGGGGGGGNGGMSIGGGGGGAGEFVAGTIVLAELATAIGCEVTQIELSVTLGLAGIDCNNGGDSLLNANGNGNNITVAIAIGGSAGLDGSEYIGYGLGIDGTTFTSSGGLGENSIKNEARSKQDRSISALNDYGDGGDGGDAGFLGHSGKSGYFAIIEFF